MLGALGTILKWVILLPLAAAIVLVAVANDQSVTVHFNPFDPDDPVLRLDLRLYQLAFALFVLGALAGALIVRLRQRRYLRRHVRPPEAASRQAARGDRKSDAEPASEVAAFLPRPERG